MSLTGKEVRGSRTERFRTGRSTVAPKNTSESLAKTPKCAEQPLILTESSQNVSNCEVEPVSMGEGGRFGRGCGAAETRPTCIDQNFTSSRTKMLLNVLPMLR